MTAVKNPTQWYPGNGNGFVLVQGTLFLTTNAGDFLVTNSGDNLVTTLDYTVPKYATLWTPTGV